MKPSSSVSKTLNASAIDESSSAEQLKATVVEKIGMKEDACFSIFERKDGWERCLEPDEKPCELMALWNSLENSTGNKTAAFVFLKRKFSYETMKGRFKI